MRKFSDITEATGKIVFAFGRFNPPTTGHEKLINKVAQISGSDPYRIYPSFTQNPKKDPLPHALKVAYMRKMFSRHARNIIADKKALTAMHIAVKLYDEGFKDLVMVAGSDRLKEFDSLLNRYNGVTGKRHGYYKFNTISVVSAGERDPDAEGVTGMSASKMRAAAVEGDEKSFAMGVPKGFRDVSKLFQDVRKYMGIREDKDMGSMTDFENVRDAYLTGKVWNVGDLIEANGVTGIIIRKGTNYVSYNDGDGKVHKAWLHDITLDERNYAKEYANYQGRPEQIARRSSRNKARRLMGDKAVKGMDVGHKDNNPLNNDPKNLKMEDPSKNRREPRLREKSDLDEIPMALLKVKNAISQMTHPKEYDSMVKKYVRYMSEPKPYASKGVIIGDIVKQHKHVNPRGFQQYINKLVSKGKLPKKLEADFDIVAEVKQDKDIKDREGTQPAKYYAKDTEGDAMSPSTKKKRAAHFAKKKKGPAPGDASATTRPSKHTQKFKQMYGEAKAVAGGKVHKFIKGHNLPIGGKKYKEIEFETKGVDNSSKTVKLMVIHPKKIFGKEFNVPFKTLRMGPFTKLDIPNQMEVLGKDADMGDYIKDFEKSDSPQFKGKSKEKRKDMAIAAYLSRNETMIDEAIEGLKNKSKKSGISYSILKKVYDRGMAAYKTGHRPGTTSQQWAMARVNSFITKGSGTWGKADKDLADKVRGEAVSPEQQAAIAISKKKKASEKSVKEWFEANATRAKYQLQHGDDWWWKMNETHDAMLEKLGLCCDDCLDEANGPCWDGYKQVGMKNKGGKQVPNCVPEENNIDEADDKLLDVLKKKLSDEGGAAGFKDLEDAADKVGVDLTQDMLKKMSGIKQHRDGDYILEELDEGMKSTHVVVEPNGNVLGAASDEKGAKDMTVSNLRNVKGAKVIKLKRPISDKQVQRMLGRPFKESKLVKFNQFESLNAWGELPEEDKSGKKLNNPTRGDVKKYKVYVKNDKGNVVKVEFGDPNMSIKRDDPERRKSFRARHNCDNPGPKWKARYWSCKFWSTKSVTDLMKG